MTQFEQFAIKAHLVLSHHNQVYIAWSILCMSWKDAGNLILRDFLSSDLRDVFNGFQSCPPH